jgi:hypothetical protein
MEGDGNGENMMLAYFYRLGQAFGAGLENPM